MPELTSSEIGIVGEQKAVEFLKKKGFRVIARNWKAPRWGEIDIIAVEKDTLVFVEVKTRSGSGFGMPYDSVNYYKLKTLVRAAQLYKKENPNTPESTRIDVVSIVLGNKNSIEHFINVYDH